MCHVKQSFLSRFRGLQEEKEGRKRAGRDARYTAGLSETVRPAALKALDHLIREAAYRAIIDVLGNREAVITPDSLIIIALGAHIAVIEQVGDSRIQL